MVTDSENNAITDKIHILYFPINITEVLGFYTTGYEVENTSTPQILFHITQSETSSSIKIQAYRINSSYEVPYGRYLLISH